MSDIGNVQPGAEYIPVDGFDEDPQFPESEPSLHMMPPEGADADEGFGEQISQDVEGLLFLGALTKSVEIGTHTIVLRTLRAGEELTCAQIIKEYDGTLAAPRAFTMARVAASIVSVDGLPLATALGPAETATAVRQRFEYVKENWYWPIIEELFFHVSDLTVKQAEALDEVMGK